MPERGPAARVNADRAGIWTRIVPDTRLRRRQQCELIWRLGARVFFELIDELDRRHGLGADLDARFGTPDPNGKAIFKPIIEFRDRATADRIGALAIELVRAAYLDAIDAA